MKTEAEVLNVIELIKRVAALAPNDETLAVLVAMYGALRWALEIEPEHSKVQMTIDAMRDAVVRNDAAAAARRN